MPKDKNEVDEKVMPVAVVTANGYIAWLTDWLMSEDWMKSNAGDKLYSAATVAELRAEVERLRTGMAAITRKGMECADRAAAAERRVGELEAAAFAARGRLNYLNSLTGEKIDADIIDKINAALTGADPT